MFGDGVHDEFPGAQLSKITAEAVADESVAVKDKWMTHMHQLLSTGLALEELSRDGRKRLVV